MVTIINPNATLSETQMAQLREKLGNVEILALPTNFPAAAKGGVFNAAYTAAQTYPEFELWIPNGMAAGAAAIMATLHGMRNSRFPEIVIFGKPPTFDFLGTVNLDRVRNQARETRFEVNTGVPKDEVIVLNFSHPLTQNQRGEIAALRGVDMKQLDIREGLSRQYVYNSAEELVSAVKAQIDDAKMTTNAWQHQRILVNLPAHAAGAMIAIAEMHGRMGYFPSILRIEKVGEAFEFTEIVRIDELRLNALNEYRLNAEISKTTALAEVLTALVSEMYDEADLAVRSQKSGLSVVVNGNEIRIQAGNNDFEFVLNISSARIEPRKS